MMGKHRDGSVLPYLCVDKSNALSLEANKPSYAPFRFSPFFFLAALPTGCPAAVSVDRRGGSASRIAGRAGFSFFQAFLSFRVMPQPRHQPVASS